MRYYVIIRYVSLALLLNSFFLLLSFGVSIFYSDEAMIPLLYSGLIIALIGLFPLIFVPPTKNITNKEGLFIVVSSWIVSCLIGTLPYILWEGNISMINAWFESVSGFTTTGSTIFENIESLPKGLLFWRASTHWIGGTGIIIFALSILPSLGIAEMVLFRSEISTMARENFNQRARRAIHILFGVYLILTFLETALLLIFGMDLFDAVTHSFATIATGGFSPKNASIAFYNSYQIEIIVIVFMILSGIHFAILFAVVTGNESAFWKSTVVRYYLLSMFIGIAIVSINLHFNHSQPWLDSIRQSAFQIVSVGTSTGFATADSSVWPPLSHLILIFFTLQCACAGSTSGGIKADRIVLLGKAFAQRVKMVMHPNAVIPLRLDKVVIRDDVVYKSIMFIVSYILIVFISTFLLSLLEVDNLTGFTGSIAAMGNVGPGLGDVGSVGNFNGIPGLGKWILTVVMLLGRLEIFAFFVFLTPAQWRSTTAY
jgi:trk/ktr system potassium uptake protein